MTKPCVHFVGFKDDDFVRAQKVWGKPDFIHKWHDHRMWGDIDPDRDTVVFANGIDPVTPSQWTWQDHTLW